MVKVAVLALSVLLLLFAIFKPDEKSPRSSASLLKVTGIVTLDGVPLSEGEIILQNPQTHESFSGIIQEGKFQVNAPEGIQKVLITSWQDMVPAGQPTASLTETSLPRKQILPPTFNVRTKLSILVQPDRICFEFPLKSSGDYDRLRSRPPL